MHNIVDGIRIFEKIDRAMSLEEGMHVLLGRLGLNASRARKMAHDRYPCARPKEEKRSFHDFRIKCFVLSDIMFTDVLHAGYDELRHLGIGRRYLTNKILRAVVAGTCDAIDMTGMSGDFPPLSWVADCRAARTRLVQLRAIELVKHEDSKLLKSIKTRMRMISTDVLKCLADNCSAIRTGVRECVERGTMTGLRYLSDMMVQYRKRYLYVTRNWDMKNRKKRKKRRRRLRPDQYEKKKRKWGRDRASRQLGHFGQRILVIGLNDLRKLMDPKIPNWYRRPTDDDWMEGSAKECVNTRKPFSFRRSESFRKLGLGSVPGVTEPISAEEWGLVKTDWTLDELRKKFFEKNEKAM